jgi:hypothetical protein
VNSRAFHIVLISFGVLMLLARPFLVYGIAAQRSYAGNPQKVSNLFQRLIKKKEDHHDMTEIAFAEAKQSYVRFRMPVRFIFLYLENFNRLFWKLYSAYTPAKSSLYYTGQYHSSLLTCRLQV